MLLRDRLQEFDKKAKQETAEAEDRLRRIHELRAARVHDAELADSELAMNINRACYSH